MKRSRYRNIRPRFVRRALLSAVAAGSVLSLAAYGGSWNAVSASSGFQLIAQHKISYAKYMNSPKLNDNVTTRTCHAGALKLTFWSWVPGLERPINLYNLTHPKVCVQWVNTAGENEDEKLDAAMKAGSGVPDLFQDQQAYVNNWILTKNVANLDAYGAKRLKKDYPTWVWKIVSPFGSKVYAVPQDSGPMGLLYNSAAFAKYHLTVPKTWAQFATEAESLHKAHPTVYLANFESFPWEQLLYWQDGAYPIKWHGTTALKMNYVTSAARKQAAFWQKLWTSGALANFSSTGTLKAQSDGTLLTEWGPAWYPDTYTTPGSTNGKWRVADLPQLSAGQHVYPNDGGSVDFVSAASTHKKQAFEFDAWLNGSIPSWELMVKAPIDLFPTYQPELKSSAFLDGTLPLTGPQKLWSVYATIAKHVKTNWEWSPIEQDAETEFGDLFDKVLAHKATLPSILPKMQSAVTKEARTAGFTVSK